MRFSTESGRLEAFSDGVIAVIITIMVLDLRPPHGTDVVALRAVAPTFLAYVLSFVFVGIYWNNHHHMLRAAGGIDGRAMWANLHLLFWLSLVPFTTSWLGANPFAAIPTGLYGLDLLFCAIAFTLLKLSLIGVSPSSALARGTKSDRKGNLSLVLYALAIVCAFVAPGIAYALFVSVAIIWFLPDRRIEKAIATGEPYDRYGPGGRAS